MAAANTIKSPAGGSGPTDCYDALLMTIGQNGGSLHSRLAIQKLCYFYAQKIGGFGPKYEPHFYGPFSGEVASALADLCAFSFVHEIAYSGFYGGYTYEFTKDGEQFAEVSEKLPGERAQIKSVLDICKSRCDLKPAPLSYAAKCHYALGVDGGEKHAVRDLEEAGRDLRCEMSKADVEDGTRLLEDLRLVSRPGSSANR